MAEIEEMKIENAEIEEIWLENRVLLTRVYFGRGDEFVTISGNDASIYLKFIRARRRFMELANDLDDKESAIREKYKGKANTEMSDEDDEKILELYRDLYGESKSIMDGVFGEGATERFWSDVFEVIPDFVPKTEAWEDYFDSLVPVMNKLFEHEKRLEKLSSMKRMGKYQPQDHKRKGTK